MKELAVSAWFLVHGVLRRAYFLIFAAFLDPIDLYSLLKPDGWPEMPIPDWVFWVAFWFTLAIAILLTFHDARIHGGRKPLRYGLLEIRDYVAKRGWEIGGKSMDALDLLDAIKQSVVFGDAALWGRYDRYGDGSSGLTRNEPMTAVDAKHFDVYDIDVSSILNAKTNLDIITYSLRGPYNGSVTRGGYRDLTMELPSLKAWEKEARKGFKGRRDVEEREAEAARIREDMKKG